MGLLSSTVISVGLSELSDKCFRGMLHNGHDCQEKDIFYRFAFFALFYSSVGIRHVTKAWIYTIAAMAYSATISIH